MSLGASAAGTRAWPSLRLRAAHLFALSGFAVAQPILDLLDSAPEFFAVHGSQAVDLVSLALWTLVVPPAVLVAVQAFASLLRRGLGNALHAVFIGQLAGLLGIETARLLDAPAKAALAAFVVLAVASPVLYLRFAPIRSFLSLLAIMPVVLFALFVVQSPSARLLLAGDPAANTTMTATSTAPVIMVVLDELPTASLMTADGRVDAGRYPDLARFASSATWFRNATTVHSHTVGAVPALLTGVLPAEDALPVLIDHPDNLFTFFDGSYRREVFESLSHLCHGPGCHRRSSAFTDRALALGRALPGVYATSLQPASPIAVRLPLVSFNNQDHDLVSEADPALPLDALTASIDGSSARTLYFAHALLPHSPWAYLPSGRRYQPPFVGPNHPFTWPKDRHAADQGLQAHLLQTMYTDRLLGRLFDRLRAEGLYDRSLIVVTADHGVAFRPGSPRRVVTQTNFGDIAFVPFMIKAPSQREPIVSDEHIRTVDVLPTIADLLDQEIPWRTDGRSGFRGGSGRELVSLVRRSDGGMISAPFKRLLADRDRTVRYIAAAATDRRGRIDPYALGPEPGLLGTRTRHHTVLRESALAATSPSVVDRAGALTSPSRLVGTITGERSRPGLRLAVAVNGRVVATTWTIRQQGSTAYSAFVPESALRPGRNEVQLFLVDRSVGAVELREIPG